MLKQKSSVSKVPLVMLAVLILMLVLASYVYTGNFTSGIEPMIEEEVLNPFEDKLGDILMYELDDVNVPAD